MSKVIICANQTGGVAKATTTVNLGIGLARMGKRVLLIDNDPQGSLTEALGYQEPDRLEITMAQIMEWVLNEEDFKLDAGILHHVEGVDLMPANIELSGVEHAFFSKLSDIEKFFILVYVGCSPLHDKMTLNQLSADELLVTIVERSKKFSKNICVGTVVIPRPYTSRTAEAVILEDVNDSLIRYQRAQAKKTLMTLKSGLGFDDIAGKCGVAYFMHQWELLKDKYQE